jgi:hypothetical protein
MVDPSSRDRYWDPNTVRVSAKDLMAIAKDLEAIRDRDPEADLSEAALHMAARRSKRNPRKANALYSRLIALTRVVVRGAPGWTLPKLADGTIPTRDVVFAAAARQPLVLSGKNYEFDRDGLLTRVLELAESETSA